MAKPQLLFLQCMLVFFLAELSCLCHGDIGPVSHYSQPYMPTACYNNDPGQFPTNTMFAAAGEGIWDNGAACGRQFYVRCISGLRPGICTDQTILVKIVDRAATSVSRPARDHSIIVLSDVAFRKISRSPLTPFVNAEFRAV